MQVTQRIAIPLLLGGFFAGCTDSPSTADGIDADALPNLTLLEEVRIGSVEDPNYGFSRIGSVDVDDEGNIYVFEAADLQIRVYSESGEFLRTFGRRGQGPGEFPTALVRFGLTNDTLWAWSSMGGVGANAVGRITLFAPDGRVLSTDALRQIFWYDWEGNCTPIVPEMTSARGYLIGDRYPGITYAPFCPPSAGASMADTVTLEVPRIQFATDGTVVDTAGSYQVERWTGTRDVVQVGQFEYPVPLPPTDLQLSIGFPDGLYQVDRPVATNASRGHFNVVRRNLDGDTIFSRTFEYVPRTYSAAVLDSMAARFAPRTGQVRSTPNGPPTERTAQDSIAAHEAIRRAISFPPYQPPVQAAHAGRDGTLWLRREDTGGATLRWMVVDSAGAPIGEVQLPRSGFQILWSRGDQFLAVENDALGVPWLIRYAID